MLIINVLISKRISIIIRGQFSHSLSVILFRNNQISNQQQQYSVNGTLKLVNTIEEFKTFDIDEALKSESSIVRGT